MTENSNLTLDEFISNTESTHREVDVIYIIHDEEETYTITNQLPLGSRLSPQSEVYAYKDRGEREEWNDKKGRLIRFIKVYEVWIINKKEDYEL